MSKMKKKLDSFLPNTIYIPSKCSYGHAESIFDNALKNFWQSAEKFSFCSRKNYKSFFHRNWDTAKMQKVFEFRKFKKVMKVPSWNLRVHLSKKLLQQNLTANDLPVVAGCPVPVILKFVVSFCFHPIRNELHRRFLRYAFSLIGFFWPEKKNFGKNADIVHTNKLISFHLFSIVKKWYEINYQSNSIFPQNGPMETLKGCSATPRVNFANQSKFLCLFSGMDNTTFSSKENHCLQIFFWTRRM